MNVDPAAALPALSARHRAALDEALAWVRAELDPLGIVVTGSIVRGEAHAASDLDIVVRWRGPGRRRVQRRFAGVAAEVFANSDDWLRRSMDDEARTGRPVMAHMLATGVVLADDAAGALAGLIAEARTRLDAGLAWSGDDLLQHRYHAACAVEDALDLLADRPCAGAPPSPDARLAVARAVEGLLAHAWFRRGAWLPRPKVRLAALARADAAAAGHLVAVLDALQSDGAVDDALRTAAHAVLGTDGCFEWDSGPPSPSPPP